MTLNLKQAAEAMDARIIGNIPAEPVSSFSTDSRSVENGALFFALRGESHDGHDYASSAADKGAAAVVVDHEITGAPAQLVVPDTLKALQILARYARKQWNGTSIGVTGSAGKTTVKDAIADVLSTALRVGKTQGNFNNHVGLPLSILNLPSESQVAVLEIGMNHAGEIRDLCRVALPDLGVVTNVGTAHLENFEGIDGVALAKRELIEGLPPAGTAILNADDPRVAAFAAIHPGRTISYGLSERATVRAINARFDWRGSGFTIPGAGDFTCSLPGRSGVMTALAALACAHAFGLPCGSLKEPIASFKPGRMRLNRFEHAGMTIWNDCYNSNPEAARMMLELLQNTPAQRRIAVLGEMLELGRWSRDLHSDLGRYVTACGIDVLVGIRGAARFMVDSAVGAGLPESSTLYFDEPVEAGRCLKSLARRADAILFKGSRGTRVELALEEFLR